jgi:cytoskeletal protein CcmA (bactofilin family)
MRIDGTVEGDVEVLGNLIIGETGRDHCHHQIAKLPCFGCSTW